MKIEAVVFDVGETLIDETIVWSAWADWLGVPRFTFMAALGAVIERDEHHRQVFEHFRPGFDLRAADEERTRAGSLVWFGPHDLYPDVETAFRSLDKAGFRLAIAGNQPRGAEDILHGLGLPVELVASSERWGVDKPSPAFFERLCTELKLEPARIAYVGDRVDNDIRPANAARMITVFVRRGPWGYIHSLRPEADEAKFRVDGLDEIPSLLTHWNAAQIPIREFTT